MARKTLLALGTCAAGVGAALAPASPGAAAPSYVELGTLGGTAARPLALNDSGVVVGWSHDAQDAQRAVVWKTGTPTDVQPAGATQGRAIDVNAAGQALVDAWRVQQSGSSASQAWLWKDGTYTKVSAFNSGSVRALDLNDAGDVSVAHAAVELFGTWQYSLGRWRRGGVVDFASPSPFTCCGANARFINSSGQITYIRSLGPVYEGAYLSSSGLFGSTKITVPGLTQPYVSALNDSGTVAGTGFDSQAITRHYVWRNGTGTVLPGLGGTSYPCGPDVDDQWYPQRLGMNAAGEVAGASGTPSGQLHAYLWRSGAITDLGTLPGDVCSAAVAINNEGLVLGYSSDGATRTPVVWRNGAVVALPVPAGSVLASVIALNDSDQAIGSVRRADGTERALRWTVPA